MAETAPTTVIVKNDAFDTSYGTPRRMVSVYIECSPAASDTTGLSSYVNGISAITGLRFSGYSTSIMDGIGSMPTWSTSTITWTIGGAQFAEFVGYYT